MDDKKAKLREGFQQILANLEVTGEAVIMDKDGNVKRRLKIRKLKEVDSNATSDSTSE